MELWILPIPAAPPRLPLLLLKPWRHLGQAVDTGSPPPQCSAEKGKPEESRGTSHLMLVRLLLFSRTGCALASEGLPEVDCFRCLHIRQ